MEWLILGFLEGNFPKRRANIGLEDASMAQEPKARAKKNRPEGRW
jgi:hypothetical protein